MNSVPIETIVKDPDRVLDMTKEGHLLLARDGRPVAMLVNLEIYDWEDLQYQTSPEFWEMIRARRADQDFVPLEEVFERLEIHEGALEGA